MSLCRRRLLFEQFVWIYYIHMLCTTYIYIFLVLYICVCSFWGVVEWVSFLVVVVVVVLSSAAVCWWHGGCYHFTIIKDTLSDANQTEEHIDPLELKICYKAFAIVIYILLKMLSLFAPYLSFTMWFKNWLSTFWDNKDYLRSVLSPLNKWIFSLNNVIPEFCAYKTLTYMLN